MEEIPSAMSDQQLAIKRSALPEDSMKPLQEVQQLNEQILSAAAKGDFAPFADALDDDVTVFDHIPYLFESKPPFLEYLQSAFVGAESTTYTVHQSWARALTETTVVMNAYDRLTIFAKGGGLPKVQCGRVTWVYVKKGSNWKIASAHFSPLPSE